mmetsp:Transcript_14698/g.27236  ORF Transcript_14698/g.27236 Transcript_14698/m.27236 type:complete len:228 (-) Transcript_14698:2457-3140(-)
MSWPIAGIFFSFLIYVEALQGIDVSIAVSDFTCIKKAYPDFVLIKAFDNIGSINSNALNNIKAAKAAGYSDIELTFYPSVLTGDPDGQVNNFMNTFAGQPYNIVWIMVERGAWPSDTGVNQQFLSSLTSAFVGKNQKIGISTSQTDWVNLMGSNATSYSRYNLRYTSLGSSNSSFTDFTSFGGWGSAYAKKYSDAVTVCTYSVGLDYKNSTSVPSLELELGGRVYYA